MGQTFVAETLARHGSEAFSESFAFENFKLLYIVEDVALWRLRENGEEFLTLVHLSFPNHWSPQEKKRRNRPLAGDEEPVSPPGQRALDELDQSAVPSKREDQNSPALRGGD